MPKYYGADVEARLLVSELSSSTTRHPEKKAGGRAFNANVESANMSLARGEKLSETAVPCSTDGSHVHFLGEHCHIPLLVVQTGAPRPRNASPVTVLRSLTKSERTSDSISAAGQIGRTYLSTASTLTPNASASQDPTLTLDQTERAVESHNDQGGGEGYEHDLGSNSDTVLGFQGANFQSRPSVEDWNQTMGKKWKDVESNAEGLTTTALSNSVHITHKALGVFIKLGPKSLKRTNGPEGAKDLKLEVFVNGMFASTSFVPSRGQHPILDKGIILSGHRSDRLLERAWQLTKPAWHGEKMGAEQLHNSNLVRWAIISKSLKEEALKIGTDSQGCRSAVGDYLLSLSTMEASSEVLKSPTSRNGQLGIIDVILSLGEGKKYGTTVGYLDTPQRMEDPRYSLSLEAPNPAMSVSVPQDSRTGSLIYLSTTLTGIESSKGTANDCSSHQTMRDGKLNIGEDQMHPPTQRNQRKPPTHSYQTGGSAMSVSQSIQVSPCDPNSPHFRRHSVSSPLGFLDAVRLANDGQEIIKDCNVGLSHPLSKSGPRIVARRRSVPFARGYAGNSASFNRGHGKISLNPNNNAGQQQPCRPSCTSHSLTPPKKDSPVSTDTKRSSIRLRLSKSPPANKPVERSAHQGSHRGDLASTLANPFLGRTGMFGKPSSNSAVQPGPNYTPQLRPAQIAGTCIPANRQDLPCTSSVSERTDTQTPSSSATPPPKTLLAPSSPRASILVRHVTVSLGSDNIKFSREVRPHRLQPSKQGSFLSPTKQVARRPSKPFPYGLRELEPSKTAFADEGLVLHQRVPAQDHATQPMTYRQQIMALQQGESPRLPTATPFTEKLDETEAAPGTPDDSSSGYYLMQPPPPKRKVSQPLTASSSSEASKKSNNRNVKGNSPGPSARSQLSESRTPNLSPNTTPATAGGADNMTAARYRTQSLQPSTSSITHTTSDASHRLTQTPSRSQSLTSEPPCKRRATEEAVLRSGLDTYSNGDFVASSKTEQQHSRNKEFTIPETSIGSVVTYCGNPPSQRRENTEGRSVRTRGQERKEEEAREAELQRVRDRKKGKFKRSASLATLAGEDARTKDPEPDLYGVRQIRSERAGEFRESEVLVAFRFLVPEGAGWTSAELEI